MKKRLTLILTTLVVLFGCSSPKGRLQVTRTVFADAWPLTIEEGTLTCAQGDAIVLIAGKRRYAVNGIARSTHQGEDIGPIWDLPILPGVKTEITPLLDVGIGLCESMKNGLPTPAIPPPSDAKQRRVHGGHADLPNEVLKRISSAYIVGTDFFGHPDKLCTLLDGVGFVSNGAALKYNWGCDSDLYDIPLGPTDLSFRAPTVMEYQVLGYQQRAEQIILQLSLNDLSHKQVATQRYLKTAQTIFSGLGVPFPAGLLAAIERDDNFRSEQPYGNVYLWVKKTVSPDARDRGREIAFFELELRDRRAEASAKVAYRDVFASCLQETIQYYPVPLEELTGDGIPWFSSEGKAVFDVYWGKKPFLCTVTTNGQIEVEESGVIDPDRHKY